MPHPCPVCTGGMGCLYSAAENAALRTSVPGWAQSEVPQAPVLSARRGGQKTEALCAHAFSPPPRYREKRADQLFRLLSVRRKPQFPPWPFTRRGHRGRPSNAAAARTCKPLPATHTRKDDIISSCLLHTRVILPPYSRPRKRPFQHKAFSAEQTNEA